MKTLFVILFAAFALIQTLSYLGIMSYMRKRGETAARVVRNKEFARLWKRYQELTLQETGSKGIYHWLFLFTLFLLPLVLVIGLLAII